MKSKIEYPRTPDMPASNRPFSPAVRVGELIFVSGQASVDASGTIVPDSFDGEVRRSFDNLRRIVEGSGSDMSRVIQTRNYVRDPAKVGRFNEIYREYFSEPFPTRTTITHCLPETLQFEVECVAVAK